MKKIIAMIVAVVLVGVLGYAAPERKTSQDKIDKKQLVDESLGDTNALVQAILNANTTEDLKPILMKMLNAQMAESGKIKKKKDK